MWAVGEPDFMDAVLPLVCLPEQISGRNRMERRLIVDAIRNDPEWTSEDFRVSPTSVLQQLVRSDQLILALNSQMTFTVAVHQQTN